MKKVILFLLCIFTVQSALADGPVYLPILTKGDSMAINPILRITNGTDVIDLLGNESGWELEDPYWNPQIAQYKGGGSYVNSGLAEGQRLVHKEYDNVVETIPLSARGYNQDKAIQTIRRLLQMAKQASDYWVKPYEYDDVWIEVRPACNDCLTGYARVVKMSIPELTNPYGQPFFSSFNEAVMNGITLTIEREPLWRGLPPGEILGPMYNLLKNPDFELWNFGVSDSQPDSWSDLETLQITGQNSRETTAPNSGLNSLKVRVSGSTAAGKAKGVTQIVENTLNNTEYTIIAWVRSDGVSNGVGRILVTYSSQLELYRSSDRHGWTLYTGKFTTSVNDVVAVNVEILTTAANTDGTIYVDSMMLLEGDFEAEAAQGTLPYMSSSHIVNHWDQPGGAVATAGAINWVDVWNVPGDEDALVRLEALNNSSIVDPSTVVEKIATLRVGQRRLGNVLNFQNYNDPPGTADTTASSNDYISPGALSSSWQNITTNLITGAIDVGDNQGRFRAYARVYDARSSGSPNLGSRLVYFTGTAGVNEKTLQPVTAPVRANWCIVGLTPNAAIIREYKHTPNTPGQLGYTIQFQRPAGTDTARLDYVLLLPTDGGFFTGEITPAVEPGTAVIVDNTGPAIQASATGLKVGYITTWDSGIFSSIGQIIEFKGYTYITIGVLVYRRPSGQVSGWNRVAALGSDFGRQFDIWNGKLYAGIGDPGPPEVWSSSNGTSWALAFTPTAFINEVTAVKAFDGYLWAAAYSKIGRWDGSTFTQSADIAGLVFSRFAVYKNQLYAISTDVTSYLYVRQYGDVWSQVGIIPGVPRTPVEFNRKLYIPSERYVVSYNGNSIVTEKDFGAGEFINSLAVVDNKIYAIGIRVYVSEDGSTWDVIYDRAALGLSFMYAVLGTQGRLDIGGQDATPHTVVVSIVPDKIVQYDLANFQGGGFTAPPRRFADPRRHRWVFSWDREGYINNADDKVLIGLGYVPRYLTLRGAN